MCHNLDDFICNICGEKHELCRCGEECNEDINLILEEDERSQDDT